jgi:nuclear transport factor 2 (NTF2) superfamily protein
MASLKPIFMKNSIPTGKKFLQHTVCFFLLLFLVSCNNKPALPTADEAEAAIWDKIEMANDRWASGDPMGFVDCAAEDIIWIDDLGAMEGVSGKEALDAYLANFKGQIPPHQHELVDPVFQHYGDMVVVSYRYQGTFENEPAEPWKVTSVYRYADGDWQSVHENWSVVHQQ